MHIGLSIFNTDTAIRIEELAREAEDRGFESLGSRAHPYSGQPPHARILAEVRFRTSICARSILLLPWPMPLP